MLPLEMRSFYAILLIKKMPINIFLVNREGYKIVLRMMVKMYVHTLVSVCVHTQMHREYL